MTYKSTVKINFISISLQLQLYGAITFPFDKQKIVLLLFVYFVWLMFVLSTIEPIKLRTA